MWRPDAKVCGQEIIQLFDLAAPNLAGWVLVKTEIGYRAVHRNGLQTLWHDAADDAVLEAYETEKQYRAFKAKHPTGKLKFLGDNGEKVIDDEIRDTGKAEDTAENA